MKKVQLNKNSWHYKYYQLIVGDEKPKSLCPYFWLMLILVLCSPIVLIVYVISKINDFIVIRLPKGKSKPNKSYEELDREFQELRTKRIKRSIFFNKLTEITSKVFKWCILPIGILGIIYIVYLGGNEIGWLRLLYHLLIALLLVGILVGVFYLLFKYEDNLKGGIKSFFRVINPLNWKWIQIIGHMIKAWYTKACPLIEWKEDEKNTSENFELRK